jgi:hypothetical protein
MYAREGEESQRTKNDPRLELKNSATIKEIQNDEQIGQESNLPMGNPHIFSSSIAIKRFSLVDRHSDLKIFSQISAGRYEQNHPYRKVRMIRAEMIICSNIVTRRKLEVDQRDH